MNGKNHRVITGCIRFLDVWLHASFKKTVALGIVIMLIYIAVMW